MILYIMYILYWTCLYILLCRRMRSETNVPQVKDAWEIKGRVDETNGKLRKRFLNSSELWTSMRQAHKKEQRWSHIWTWPWRSARHLFFASGPGDLVKTLGMRLLKTNMHGMLTLIVQHCCHPIVPNLSLQVGVAGKCPCIQPVVPPFWLAFPGHSGVILLQMLKSQPVSTISRVCVTSDAFFVLFPLSTDS